MCRGAGSCLYCCQPIGLHKKANYQHGDESHNGAIKEGKRSPQSLPKRPSDETGRQRDDTDDKIIGTKCGCFEMNGRQIRYERFWYRVGKAVIESIDWKQDPDEER